MPPSRCWCAICAPWGVDPENPRLLVAAVFFRDYCYLIQGTDLMDWLKEQEGLNDQALHFRVLRRLSEPLPDKVSP